MLNSDSSGKLKLLIKKLRKKIDESKESVEHSDASLRELILSYPLPIGSSNPKSFDLNAAATQVWDDKVSALAADYDFSEDGGSYKRSQAYVHAKERYQHFKSLAKYRFGKKARSVKVL